MRDLRGFRPPLDGHRGRRERCLKLSARVRCRRPGEYFRRCRELFCIEIVGAPQPRLADGGALMQQRTSYGHQEVAAGGRLFDEAYDAMLERVKSKAAELETLFEAVKPGRYRSLGLTALEEAVMWAIKELTS